MIDIIGFYNKYKRYWQMLTEHKLPSDIYVDPLFLSKNQTSENLLSLFHQLPGVIFFAKDLESRFMAANQAMLDSKGLHSHKQIIGFNDFDFSPPALARIHVQQDRQVFNHGEAISNQVWFRIEPTGEVRWILSSKQPLKAIDGYTYGLVGVSYYLAPGQQVERFFGNLDPVIQHIQSNFARGICMDRMAELAGMSAYDFNIEFLNCLDMPLHQFTHCYRMEIARHLLRSTSQSEQEISFSLGFFQIEDFKRHFMRWNGIDAQEYRNRFGQPATASILY